MITGGVPQPQLQGGDHAAACGEHGRSDRQNGGRHLRVGDGDAGEPDLPQGVPEPVRFRQRGRRVALEAVRDDPVDDVRRGESQQRLPQRRRVGRQGARPSTAPARSEEPSPLTGFSMNATRRLSSTPNRTLVPVAAEVSSMTRRTICSQDADIGALPPVGALPPIVASRAPTRYQASSVRSSTPNDVSSVTSRWTVERGSPVSTAISVREWASPLENVSRIATTLLVTDRPCAVVLPAICIPSMTVWP
jgi:hypothetical protein